MALLLVSVLVFTYPGLDVVARGAIRAHRDIFKGVWMPYTQKRIWDAYLVFDGPEERIRRLEAFFRKLFDGVGLRSKYLVQRRVRKLRTWICIAEPDWLAL